jgi:N-acetyl-anhydromuramyl-L-alanine amidase AmpD
MPDEPGVLWVPTDHRWAGGNTPRYVIVHGTGSSLSETAQHVAQFFQTNDPPTSTHYVIGRDGAVVQCVAEADAAWGNGVISAGADVWWHDNPNNYTISIEHVNDSANSTPLTAEQQAASFALIGHICERHGIPKRPADASGGITGHYSIDPVNRAHCPGNYPWAALWAALGANVTYSDANMGQGFKDYADQHQITAPNLTSGEVFNVMEPGVSFTAWDWPQSVALLYSQQTGVRDDMAGHIVGAVYHALLAEQAAHKADVAKLQQQITQLQAQLASATQTATDPEATKKAAAFDSIVTALETK